MTQAAYKVMVDDDNRILGAHIISDNASGLINSFKQAMHDHRSVEDLYWEHVDDTLSLAEESDIIYMLKPFFEDDLLAGL